MAPDLSRVGVVAEVVNMEQHDHHCWITFAGCNWRIRRMRRHLIYGEMSTIDGLVFVTIDIADVDFDSYCTAAAAWDNARERA